MTSAYSNADDGGVDGSGGGRDRSVPDLEPRFVAVVERYDAAPDECTIYPADDPRNVTEWITAREGSFVDLERMR